MSVNQDKHTATIDQPRKIEARNSTTSGKEKPEAVCLEGNNVTAPSNHFVYNTK